jgi:ABC-type transport system involved in cytochrome bd biosynthesis fused ATPase/permease subunit
MSKGVKIGVTILLIIGFVIITTLLTEAGASKTFTALLALGLFFGIREMWKKPKTEKPTEIKLEKTQKYVSDNKTGMKEWREKNPHKSINEYYKVKGNQK